MTLSLFLIGAITLTIAAAYVVTHRAYHVAEPALAGETTAVGLADPGSDTLVGHNRNHSSVQNDWNLTTVDALSDAEGLLDYLECQGYEERELTVLGNSCFAVRWK